ncbi:MAG: flavin reductase family protein [Gemmatimonadaceae bacterium]|nr:flavin reductase family protein [Gemmatimonadaceae bacterium]
MSIDPDLFRAVLGRFATGVAIVTVRDDDGRDHGMTVSAFSSLSLDPPLVLVCIGADATMAPVMQRAASFAVNILSSGQEAHSRRFAGKLDDRFTDVAGARSPSGNVLLDDALGALDCRVVARHPAGDHVIVVGEVDSGSAHDGRPLLYYRGGYAQLER